MPRSSILSISALSCLLFATAAVRLNLDYASAQSNQPVPRQLKSVSAKSVSATTVTATTTTGPGAVPKLSQPGSTYTAKRGDTIPAVARQHLHETVYLTSTELAEAIRAANNKSGDTLKAGEQITLTGLLAAPIVEHPVAVPKDFEARAIYLTGIMASSDHGLRIIRHWREVGGNAVVFDIKDSDGSVTIPFEHPLLGKHQIYIHDLPKFIHFLHSQNMHAIARVAIFRDQRLVTEHPELAVQSKKLHQPWRENGKLVWTDSSNPTVQDYNIALAKFVAQSGADEIQFDYVRFPAEGDQKDAGFLFQKDSCPDSSCEDSGTRPLNGAAASAPVTQRSQVITAFLKKAYGEIHPTGALLSLDVFGIMAWQRPVDLAHTGQDIPQMAKYADVISPMIYPSHFFGMDGIEHPGDAPEHFIGESMQRFELITKDSGALIRPWLQAFRWRTKTYSPEYIKVQVATSKEKGGIGFLFWNAANDYSKPYEAMPEMETENLKAASKDKAKFFRGDELASATEKTTEKAEVSTLK